MGGAAAGATEPPDLADSKRGHPSRLCLDHVRLPSEWRRKRGHQEDYPSDFLNWGRGCLLSSFLEAEEGDSRSQVALLYEGAKWQLPMPTVSLSGQQAQGWVIPFPVFPGTILYKAWGRHEERLFHACLCLTVSSALVLGIPSPSQVSFLGTRQRKEVLWGPSSDHISGECFHLPNPSPMICPQRGTKGPLIAKS